MNIFRAMAVKDLDEATCAIPVIDFAPAFRGEPAGIGHPTPTPPRKRGGEDRTIEHDAPPR